MTDEELKQAFLSTPWVYDAQPIKVVDGDTCDLLLRKEATLDFGFYIKVQTCVFLEGRFRLEGINTPELHSKNKHEVQKGKEAKTAVVELLNEGTLKVRSYKATGQIEADKYGRWLIKILVTRADGSAFEVTAELLKLGLALPYDGKGPRPTFDFSENG